MIKRCNDFGAGGVSVAIGELTAGLVINLDKVPKKYQGLAGTELAISESQERMAVVIAAKDLKTFIAAADVENLEATVVAEVAKNPRLVMYWRGEKIVDLSREFLDTNGVAQKTNIEVDKITENSIFSKIPNAVTAENSLAKTWLANLDRLNVCSEKGLSERFDSTVGKGTVMMPFGGKSQLTPSEGMVAKIPVPSGKTTAATVMSCGYDPQVACWSPYHGGMYAVVEAVCRATALGANASKLRLTLQEYFPKLRNAQTWGQPFSALLGAYAALDALDALEVPAIGGKDSMSGTFMDKEVPPSLVAFAVDVIDSSLAISSEFKNSGNKVVFIDCPCNEEEVIDFTVLRKNLELVHRAILAQKIVSAGTIKEGGIAAALSVRCLGNKLGFTFVKPFAHIEGLFTLQPGAFLLELAPGVEPEEIFQGIDYLNLGTLNNSAYIDINGIEIALTDVEDAYTKTLADIFPAKTPDIANMEKLDQGVYKAALPLTASYNIAKPRVFIPVFPGINC